MTAAQSSITLFLLAAVILATARLFGGLAQRYLGQPRVVGEMIAGIILGPSVFGNLAPEIQQLIFPLEAKPLLFVFAQLGVGLYMFIVGLGFDRDGFVANARGAAAVSTAGLVAPFLVAIVITPWLIARGGLFAAGIGWSQAAIFLGAAIAITAFPMLARIIHERGISGTAIGTLALSAGAIGDAGAWILIAIVLASLGDGPSSALLTIAGGLVFALFMIFKAPSLLQFLNQRAGISGVDTQILAIALIFFLLSAWAMDAIGIHAVFGGFFLGTAMPRGVVCDELRAQLEPITLVLLLPFFFTFSGLHTNLSLLASAPMLGIALVVLFVSIMAKGGASYFAARLAGYGHRDSLGVGALMNARGLMELIVINIGLERGIIAPGLFSILVLMAIVTTLMASPLFELSRRVR